MAWGHGLEGAEATRCVATAWRPKPAEVPGARGPVPEALNAGASAPKTSDPGEETPQTHAQIPIQAGSVDAISGETHLRMPLGPVMPGRLRLGFTFSYDSQNALEMTVGGEFRPIVWPTPTQKHISYTVMVQGEAWSFARAYQLSTYHNLSPTQLMGKYGIDNGQADAQKKVDALNVGNQGAAYALDTGMPEIQAYLSLDGERCLLMSQWRIHHVGTPESPADSVLVEGQRMAAINGQEFIWTDCQGVSHFQTIWGDHLTVTETNLTHNPWPPLEADNATYTGGSIVIADVNDPGRSLILNLTSTTLAVTNTFGLPSAAMQGKTRVKQRLNDDYAPASVTPLPLFDFGFAPASLTETASNGETRTTTFDWVAVNTVFPPNSLYPYALKSITHPNGLQESFTYALRAYSSLSDYAFSPDTGGWVGFSPNPTHEVWSLPVAMVSQVVQSKAGQGTCVKIQRTVPAWAPSGFQSNWPWLQRDHATTIQTYASPDGTGAYRSIKLTHPSFAGQDGNYTWGGASASQDEIVAAYLFATSAVLKAEFFDSSNALYRTVSYGGWSFRSFFNPGGSVYFSIPSANAGSTLTASLPLTPEPTQVTITERGLPTRTKQVSGWDSWSYADAQLDGKAGAQEAGTSSHVVQGYGDSLDVLEYSESHALLGSSIPDLRNGAASGFQFGQKGFSYDAMDRQTQAFTQAGKAWTMEARSFTGSNPNPVETTQYGGGDAGGTAWTPGGAMQAPPSQYALSGMTGAILDYTSGPAFLLRSQTDKLTKRATSYDYDDLDRVKSVTDPDGVTTETAYDAWGRIATVTRDAKDGVPAVATQRRYDPAGLWSKETVQAEGKVLTTTTTYDAWGRVVSVVKPDGTHQESSFDGWGELVSQTPWMKPGQTAYGNARWTYDAKGRLVKQTDAKGRTVLSAPEDPAWNDSEGGVATTVSDDRGYASTVVKDLLGQQRVVIDKAGQQASFAYDAFGHLAQVKFGAQVRSFTYNELGWLMSRSDPEEGTTAYADFTLNGMPATTRRIGRDGNGFRWLVTQLDSMGRPSQVLDQSTYSLWRAYHYDPAHATRVTALDETQPNGTIHEVYTYDPLGRMASKQITDETGQSFIVSRTLGALGNLKSLTYPGGGGHPARTLSFAYDAYLRPTDATLGALRGHMDYDQASGTAVTDTLTYGNGAKTLSTTDRGELSHVTHSLGASAVEDSALSWTAGGLLLNRGADAFAYDPLGRLSSAVVHGVQGETLTQGFGYDAYGNRTQSTVSLSGGASPEALSWTAAYDGTNSLPKQVLAPSGNALLTGAQYDVFGNLLQVWAVPGQSSTQASWTYDVEGRVVQENGTKFLLDANGLRFRRAHPDGSFEYVVYGFDRDPLSTFGSAAQRSPSLKRAPQARKPAGPAPRDHRR